VNGTVARLTLRTLLGRRRALLLLILPAVLIVLSLVVRLAAGSDPDITVGILGAFALAVVVPLLGLIAGTGAIGPEIDDGSIVYLLAKPISRQTIVTTKLAVAIGVMTTFAAVPVLVAGLLLSGLDDRLAVAFAVGALVAGVGYCALFLLLSVLTRNAVVIGLLYALVWEGLVGGFVPGAQALSVLQWAGSLTRAIVGSRADALDVTAAVSPAVGVPLLVVLIVGATITAGQRLRSLRLTGDE
jgi:ABC-2 type transport system permease protein